MTAKKAALINIGVSVGFALAIVVASKLTEGSEHAGTVTFILIAIWLIPFFILSRAANKARKRGE